MAKNNDEVVEVNKSELAAMLAEMQALRASVEKIESGDGLTNTRILKKITERKVTLRRVDGKVVLGYRNKGTESKPLFVYEGSDPKDPTKKVWFIDVILEGMKPENAIKIDYKEFLAESERVLCTVASTEEKEWSIDQGMVKKREVDGYSMIELDFDVPVEVIGKTRWFTVKLPDQDHREVKVHEAYVNI